MIKVVHIIPYDGIGGVETAAKSMGPVKHGGIDFTLHFIFQNIKGRKDVWRTFDAFKLISSGFKILKLKADVVVVSLWRSSITGLIIKLINPKIKLVPFLHNSSDVHFLDRLFTGLAIRFADAVWVDSTRTIERVLPSYREKCRVISFVTARINPLPTQAARPSFIFWGRLTLQKDVARAIRIFAEVLAARSDAHFWIIGPDGGELTELTKQCAALQIEAAVTFVGPASFDEIARHAVHASFYLQTSIYEGMAMSVVEAMQLGLVPVVTTAGEIGTYCIHGKNAFIVQSDRQAVGDVLKLLDDDNLYRKCRAGAISTWKDSILYRDSVLAACEELL